MLFFLNKSESTQYCKCVCLRASNLYAGAYRINDVSSYLKLISQCTVLRVIKRGATRVCAQSSFTREIQLQAALSFYSADSFFFVFL